MPVKDFILPMMAIWPSIVGGSRNLQVLIQLIRGLCVKCQQFDDIFYVCMSAFAVGRDSKTESKNRYHF